MIESVLFYLFGLAALILGGLVITVKNPIYSAVALIFNLCCVAVLFALLGANFLSVVQVMVYAGAILVLFVFVIMLLGQRSEGAGRTPRAFKLGAAALAALLVIGFAIRLAVTSGATLLDVPAGFGSVAAMGRLMFGPYLLPFEVASLLLLAAILGAVALAKKEIW